ncbi:MAG: gliding motility-associated C-terminal domain-containing protein [Bacteroidetes bacterium]|nr:gliding motility-associated C-terminal domain-containing protein [Bacteroidota bacterium]
MKTEIGKYKVCVLLFFLFALNTKITAQCNNVALGKPATGTGTYLTNTPDKTFDGNCGTYWNSGGFAPQSIQVDLQGTFTINNINLLVGMTPTSGNCTHTIYTAPNIGGPWTAVDVISGVRFSGEKLERCYNSAPLTGVGAVKIESTSSPSWIAWIEVGIFTLSPPPASPTITSSGSPTICQGESVTLTSSTGSSYLWNPGGQTTQSIVVDTSGNYCVTLGTSCITGTTSCTDCGGGSACATVTVTSNPTLAIAGPNAICNRQGEYAVLNATGAATYAWSPATGLSDTTGSMVTSKPTITTIYTVIGTSTFGCADTATVQVIVNPLPIISIAASPTLITSDENTTLTASGGSQYQWSPSTGLNDPSISNPIASPIQTTTYCVTVTDTATGCSDNDCVTINVENLCGTLFIPNAFSPNGDGENDTLQIYIGNLKCIKEYRLVIFDRWGEKVFESSEHQADWDGTYKGKLLDTAVFIYYLKATLATGERINKKGNISLMR